MKRYSIIIALLFSSALRAQNPYDLYSLSQQKLAEHDIPGFLQYAEQAHSFAPFDLWLTANLAKAYAMNGNKRKCIEILDDLSVIGFDFKIERDSGFANLWKHSLVKEISARAKRNSSVQTSGVAFTVPEKDLIPEGIAHDPRRNVFYLSSIYKRKVVALLPDGSTFDFIPEAGDGVLSTLGMKVDAARNHLWVLSTMQSGKARKSEPGEAGKSFIHQYDLATKQLMTVYSLEDTLKHLFNDLTILLNGDVFLTDSEEGAVYKIDIKNRMLQRWHKSEMMYFPNGITLSPDQQYLFVAHWVGISRISLADTKEVMLTTKAKTTLTGIDGIYFYDNSLIAVQNGAGPQSRIMKFELNKEFDTVTKATILESDHPNHNVPTTGVIVGGDFYYIANSQLQSFTPDGKIFPDERLEPTYILKLPLTD
ncbi:MAG: SMP-30/gluconolactonase/LRE family protein [Ignavibacteriales bacterium]|nr:SMP-30/gluconolactonase/LRE family protein [Ignavibacteriales bacterium]